MGDNIKKLTNYEMLDMVKKYQEENASFQTILQNFQKLGVISKDVPRTSFVSSLQRVQQMYKKLKKNSSDRLKLQEFLEKLYISPTVKHKMDNLDQPSEGESASKTRCQECAIFKSVNMDVCYKLKSIKENFELLQIENKKIKTRLSSMIRYTPKRVNQMMKRKREQLAIKQREIKLLRQECAKFKIKLIKTNKNGINNSQKNSTKERNKPKKICKKSHDLDAVALRDLSTNLKAAKEKISQLEYRSLYLEDKLNEMTNNTIQTKCGKIYTDEVRMAIYHCAMNHVSMENIGKVIKSVLWHLTGKYIAESDLPDVVTMTRMVSEMAELSHNHVKEILVNEKDLTLKYDGTSKKKCHFAEIQAETSNQTYTLAISELPCGGSQQYASAIKKTIEKIDSSSNSENTSGNCIIQNITNTMTDRHIVNKAVNKIVSNYKADVLGLPHGGVQLNNFYCAVHPLDTFAKTSERIVKDWEKKYLVEPNCYATRSDCGTTSLIKAVSKLFHKDGVGLPAELKSYMESKGLCKTIVQEFHGNRFNILFKNAAAISYITPLLLEFFSKVMVPANKLHKAIDVDLKSPVYQTTLRALGLVGKYVTGPWLRLTESSQFSILDLNPYYEEAQEKIKCWSTDAEQLLTTNSERPKLFAGFSGQEDKIFLSLLKPCSNDGCTKILLEKILGGILQDMQRQLADQLPGGCYSDPFSDLERQSKSCSTNNISGERVFGLLDHAFTRGPNTTISFAEAKIMFKENKSMEWLESKTPEERHKLISLARSSACKSRENQKLHRFNLIQQKRNMLQMKEQELERKQSSVRISRENLICDMCAFGGLWMTTSQMESSLQGHLQRVQIKAVKNQINVRKKILQQKADNILFCFSKNRKPFSLLQLKRNLQTLIGDEVIDSNTKYIKDVLISQDKLVDRVIRHKWCENTGDNWYDGHILERNGNEFKVEYYLPNEIETYYLHFDEIITDIQNQDLLISWD